MQRERGKERSYREGDGVYREGGSKRGKSYRERRNVQRGGEERHKDRGVYKEDVKEMRELQSGGGGGGYRERGAEGWVP